MADCERLIIKSMIKIFDLKNGYFQIIWKYQRGKQEIVHKLPRYSAINAFRTIEILLHHEYIVEDIEIFENIKKECENYG